MKKPSTIQPAIKNYFFEKGYRDLHATISSSWYYNLESAKEKFDESNVMSISDAINSEEYFEIVKNIFLKGSAFAIIVFGTAWFGILSFLHVIILGVIMFFFFCGYVMVKGIEAIYKVSYKIFSVCPESECYSKFSLPLYDCPNCGREHDNLQPSKYGVFHRICICGHKIPSSVLSGRALLETAKCRECETQLSSSEINIPVAIPIIGATDSGKTCLLYSSLIRLFENDADNFEIDFKDKESEILYNSNEVIIKKGEFPLKTNEYQPRAVLLNIRPSKSMIARTVYYFDAAGESFLSSSEIRYQKYHNYIRGLIWVIDPNSFAREIDNLFNRFLNSIENYFQKTSKKNIPLAIVFTRRDIAENRNFHDNIENNVNEDIVDYLQIGHEAFYNNLVTNFKSFRFFYISSNGLNLIDTDLPFKWLISKIDKSFKISSM